MSVPNIHFIPIGQAPLTTAAHYIIDNAKSLPDLTSTQIILNETDIAPHLRRELLSLAQVGGHPALLGPEIISFDGWLRNFIPDEVKICSEQSRLLILVEALLNAPKLLGQANAWSLADSLLGLFDELTLNRISLSEDQNTFANQLAQWYDVGHTELQGLQHEAEMVHQLWHAWHRQLQAQGLTDPITAKVMALQNSLQEMNSDTLLHLIGIEPVYQSQRDWFKQVSAQSNTHIWLHSQPHNDHNLADQAMNVLVNETGLNVNSDHRADDYEKVLHSVFDTDVHLSERAAKTRSAIAQSPLSNRLGIFSARNAEQEAHAIDLQIRQWILEGKTRIGIITENRRLARRVRAILERADIFLQDAAGWALSTTRAAASIESLLLCIETDFTSDALLDLLKSPLLFPDTERELLKRLTYRLEHDIIRNEGIASHLSRYKQAIIDRQERLTEIWPMPPSDVIDLLDHIKEATQPLQQLQAKRTATLLDYLQALITTLKQTGIYTALQNDDAGLRILQTLDNMLQAGKQHSFETRWFGFRAWLGRNMECHYFRPPQTGSPVQLLSLNQSDAQHYDAIIIAGAEKEYLPGAPTRTPFFNDAVRQQLGLPTRKTYNQQRLRQFYRLLFAAPQLLITHRSEEDGELIPESPWLAAIRSFHEQAYEHNLQHADLHDLLSTEQTQVIRCDTRNLPAKQTQPKPMVKSEYIPDTISASAYQQLLDCPYQFFVARCLRLKPAEEIQKVLSKREYGERVHECLQAFHSEHPHLPGPFIKTITESNKAEAIKLMEAITDAVFRYDLQDNYTHRGWYHQWREVIPEYIEWQIERSKTASVYATELAKEITINNQLTIKGRLDRIDKDADGYSIVDYKTGAVPKKYEIENGEKIQLPFYALLAQNETLPVNQVEYLNVGKAKDFAPRFPQTGDELHKLTQQIGDRLQSIMQQLHDGQPLPAWETDESCKYCDMTNLCRMGGWDETS